MGEEKSFCRLCLATCGMVTTTDDDGRLLSVRGDHDHPVTKGYACLTGLQSPDAHNSEARLTRPMKRLPDGSFTPIPIEQAYDEIAARLKLILDESGPNAVASFFGTAHYQNTLAAAMLPQWMRAIGSPALFSTMTVDQSAKWVTMERLGFWAAGRDNFSDSDVSLLIGANPFVSGTVLGLPCSNPVKQIKEARARGLKLIVIDPRKSETARLADIFLQPYPGEDAAIAAGLLHIILREGWEDSAFCAQYVEGLDRLRGAVEPFDPAYVAARAGVTAEALHEVAEAFARTGTRGFAVTGTGPDMGPHSNLAEHLIECLNVVCGRYRRAGDRVTNPMLLGPRQPVHAEVVPPSRSWESGHKSRIRDTGTVFGEMMSCVLADEILLPGDGRIRSLFIMGGNPVGALPDPRKTVRAFGQLDLLVTVDPFMTASARLSHYVLPPKLQYERFDCAGANPFLFSPYFQYTPPVATPPAEAVDDWRVLWEIARRLELKLSLAGVDLDMEAAPSSEELLALLNRHAQVAQEEILASRGGTLRDDIVQHVEPARPGASAKFDVMPSDVEEETRRALASRFDEGWPYRLAVRRTRGVINTAYHRLPEMRRKHPYNPAYMHPGSMADAGLSDGDRITLVSPYGRIPAILNAEEAVRPGVVSMSHGWGNVLPDEPVDYEASGASTSFLVSADERIETINAMVQLTGVPVRVAAGWEEAGAAASAAMAG